MAEGSFNGTGYKILFFFDLLREVPSLNIPDTILFQNDLPYIWYFTKDKCLKRKSNLKLTNEEIEKKFLRKVPKSGIVAVYVNQYIKNSKENVVFEYLTVQKFSKNHYIAGNKSFSRGFSL